MDKYRETLVSMFHRRVESHGNQVAILVRQGEEFVPRTWNELANDVGLTAAALRSLGIQPADRVVQVSENRYDWIVLDLAIHVARGVHVAVHSTLSGAQIAYQIADCGANLVVLSGPEQVAKLAGVAEQLPSDAKFVSHDACEATIGGKSIGLLSEIVSQSTIEASCDLAREAIANVAPGALATILYTSGTTGEPKGVMLSQGNLAFNAMASIEAFAVEPDDVRLCWLPLSHIFARTADLYVWIGCGHRLALATSRDTILADCANVHPTIMNGVPYFFDKVARVLTDQGKANVPGALGQLLGGRIRTCCAGGAALANHTAEFFNSRGVNLVQGYGMTESSPVISVGSPRNHRLGTVGPPIPGVEVRIADDGEVLTRGPHVMLGYWNKPQDTAETIRNGWLHTGDLGRMEDGYLTITGRKKELIVTAGGKNVAPTMIEALICEDPLVAQCMVIGDARNFLTALIVPERDALRNEILSRQIPVSSPAEALVNPQVRQLYAELISQRLSGLASCEQIGRFTLLGRGFTIEWDELTPTLKLRRGVVAEHFAREIRSMYEQ